jgi:uncharacterized paraquat-inducible protein A
MVRCPRCRSPRVLVVLSTQRHARCLRCAYAWTPGGTWTSPTVPEPTDRERPAFLEAPERPA